MGSNRADVYIRQLNLSKSLMQQQLNGLTDADLLRQPESRGNCANWVLGHIIASRRLVFEALEQDFIWDDAQIDLYKAGSIPITGEDSPHLTCDALMAAYEFSFDALIACIEQLSDDALEAPIDENRTVMDRVSFVVWHEAYHTGQFEYLRQLSGVDDTVP